MPVIIMLAIPNTFSIVLLCPMNKINGHVTKIA